MKFLPQQLANQIGINPETGEPLPQLKREHSPQERFQNVLDTVFDGIGGLPNMTRWAKANQSRFYKMYADTVKQAPINITDSQVVIVHSLPESPLDK